ncbi:MAG: CPBP family intramembrane glutamic endopeptidase [Cyanobacteria bacterium P01_F01_bin.143]
MNKIIAQKQAKKSLLLVVPASSIGVTMATIIAPNLIGQTIFTIIKIWIVLIPLLWVIKVEKKYLRLPSITHKQINSGVILGLIMFSAIAVSYLLVGQSLIDVSAIRTQATSVGIVNVGIYLAGCAYWSFINSFLEECIWRGFVYRQCRILIPGLGAILFSGLFFTLHHIIALAFYTQNWLITLLGSLGVLIAGIIWSVAYRKFGLWSCYISHILADLAIAVVGWHLLFT